MDWRRLLRRLFDAEGDDARGPWTRPPGAASERDLAARCIKCARCVQACPYGSIHLAGWGAGATPGTPVIRPREQPCWLCLRCPPACPTGALAPVAREAARMGVARVLPETCLAWHDTVCNQCYRHCPLGERALRLDDLLRPEVVPEACTGCGVCLHVCPTTPRSIALEPARGA